LKEVQECFYQYVKNDVHILCISNLYQKVTYLKFFNATINTPPSSLMDSTASPKVKTMEREGIGAHSLVHDTSRVKERAGAPGWGLGRLTSNSITHTNLHKPNNKLVNA
jgi:hypothetical protein